MVYTIMGKTGTGKTYFAARLVSQLSDRRKLVAIVDQEEDLVTLDEASMNEEFYVFDVDNENFDKLNYGEIIRKHDRVGFVFLNLLEEEQNDVINRICSIIYRLGNVVLYIDEAHKFFPQNNYPIELERLVRGGRKRAIDVVLVTQQVIDLRKTALKQAHVGIFFRITEENELKKLRAMGIDSNAVSNLPLYSCYVVDFITGESGVTRAEEIEW